MSERRTLIAGNWKMNGLSKDGKALANGLAKKMKKIKKGKASFEMLVCPPVPLISTVVAAVKGSKIAVGGQDCHADVGGAHTGDTAAVMLKDAGCSYVIVGHSERRADHGEKNADVKAKAEAALAAGLKAIVCIGETETQRAKGQALAVNRRQLNGSLPAGATAKNTVIAYEPVWAIGTGLTASPQQAQDVHAAIRAALIKALGEKEANKMRILYGGSMNPGNASELLSQADIDGGLIGGASLKVDDFMAVAESA